MSELRHRKVSEVAPAEPTYTQVNTNQESKSLPKAGDAPFSGVATLIDVQAARNQLYRHVSSKLGHLSLKMRMIFSAPQVAIIPVQTLLSIYGVSFYESLGANLQYLAFFLALTRALDLLLDPGMSYLTDSFRGPFGRRRPFIFVGCWVYGLMLILLLTPPKGLGKLSLAMWYGVTSVGFYVANSLTVIPYDALGIELTSSYHDRTLLYFTTAMFEFIGSIGMIGLSQLFYSSSTLDTAQCSSDSCFSTTGVGKSCFPSFTDGSYKTFNIFDIFSAQTTPQPGSHLGFVSDICTYRNGSHYDNPTKLFFPSQCVQLVPINENSTTLGTIASLPAWDSQIAQFHHYTWEERNNQCLRTYCSCVEDCGNACNIDSTRIQYSYLSIIMAAWFVITVCTLTYHVRERAQLTTTGKLLPALSPIASMVNTFRNTAFRRMLPTFICDNVAYAMVTSSMLYFVKYILRPEMQSRANGDSIDCNAGVPIPGTESVSWRCGSTNVLGALLVVMLGSAFCACPMWYYAAIRWGKQAIWLTWSFLLIVSLLLLLVIEKGDIDLSLYLSVFPGMVMGAKFIGMSILADVIEYDEFLTSQRNEGSYVMLKSLLSKLAAIPAVTFPIVILSSMDPYSSTMTNTVYVLIIWVPVFLVVISMYYKVTLPLRHKHQVDLMGDGIGLHILGLASPEPITGLDYLPSEYSATERRKLDVMDHFPYKQDAESLQTAMEENNALVGIALLVERCRDQSFFLFLLFVAAITGVVLTWTFFSTPRLSIYPIMLSVASTTFLLLLVMSLLRLRAAKQLKRSEFRPSLPLLHKIIDQRTFQQKLSRTLAVDIVGISESRRRLRTQLKLGLGLHDNSVANFDADVDVSNSSESEGEDDKKGVRKVASALRSNKKSDAVVSHWRAIINRPQPDSMDHDVSNASKNINTVMTEMLERIRKGESVEHLHATTASLIHASRTSSAALDINHTATSTMHHMTEARNPVVWDVELHSFLLAQAAENAKRKPREVKEDIIYSDTIGVHDIPQVEENQNDAHTALLETDTSSSENETSDGSSSEASSSDTSEEDDEENEETDASEHGM